MKTLLQIRSSIFSNDGQSSRLAERFVARWRASNPGGKVIVRDLAKEPVPHLDAARFGAFLTKPEERTPAQQAVVDYSDALIGELKRADVVVLGLPMYNFGVTSTLKAYFDHVARVGMYAGTPNDTQTPFIRTFLSFLGMSDIEFVYAEGLAISEASKQQSLARAQAVIDALVEPELA